MPENQSKAYRDQSMSVFDMGPYLKQTERWFDESRKFYKVCDTYAKAYTHPAKWFETAQDLVENWRMAVEGLTDLYISFVPPLSGKMASCRAESESRSEALEAVQIQLKQSQQQYEQSKIERQAIADENSTLRQTVAQKSKSSDEQQNVVSEQRKSLEKNEKEISQLQKKMEEQSERIKTLEAEASEAVAEKSKLSDQQQDMMLKQRKELEKNEKENSKLQKKTKEQSKRIKALEAEASKAAQARKKEKTAAKAKPPKKSEKKG